MRRSPDTPQAIDVLISERGPRLDAFFLAQTGRRLGDSRPNDGLRLELSG
jgi:hypothetical protein